MKEGEGRNESNDGVRERSSERPADRQAGTIRELNGEIYLEREADTRRNFRPQRALTEASARVSQSQKTYSYLHAQTARRTLIFSSCLPAAAVDKVSPTDCASFFFVFFHFFRLWRNITLCLLHMRSPV